MTQKVEVVSLRTSLGPLKDAFNSASDRKKFIAILSPTFRPCLEGARAVRHSIISRNPIPNLSIIVVWIDMMPGDNFASATGSAKNFFSDTHAAQFHDPERRAGEAFGKAVGAAGGKVAWDFYLYFDEGEVWEKKAPLPKAYLHQLKGSSWASEAQFRTGRELFDELYRVAVEEMK